ncbi:MAG: hypothetical protein WC440_02180 [Candidatus Omnitrophota bacterium]|jgi:hypothetical protein
MAKMKQSNFAISDSPAGPTPEPMIHARDVFNDAIPTPVKFYGLYKLIRKADGITFYISKKEAEAFKASKKMVEQFDIEGPIE